MVVKLLTAPIAWPTMLRPFLHVSITNDAVVVNCLPSVGPNRLESLFVDAHFTLLLAKDVSGHRCRAYIGQFECQEEADAERHGKYGANGAVDEGNPHLVILRQSMRLLEDRNDEPGDG